MAETSTLTPQDLKDAAPLADRVVDMLTKERPTVAVAAAAFALAALAHLARCGPRASVGLFEHYYRELDALGASKL